jgi:hypothetical protein
LPVELSGPISIHGTGLPKIDLVKQLLEMHEDPSFERKNGEKLESYTDLFYYGVEMSEFSCLEISSYKVFP